MAGELRLGTAAPDPATPPAGYGSLFLRPDKKPYVKDDAGTVTPIALGGVVGPANAVYLTLDGVDGSAARGDASKPFGTFKGALEACQDGDVLVIGPGDFVMTVGADVPTWPAGCDHLTVRGTTPPTIGLAGLPFGTGGTRILNSVNDGSHVFAPPATVQSLVLQDLYAEVTAGAGRALFCDGTGAGGSYLGGGSLGSGMLKVINCVLTGAVNALSLRFVGIAEFVNVITTLLTPGATEILTSNVFRCIDSKFRDTTIDWTAGGDAPTIGRLNVAFADCELGDVTITGVHEVGFEECSGENVVLGGAPEVGFTRSVFRDIDGSAGFAVIGGQGPRVSFLDAACDSVDFLTGGSEYPDTAAPQSLDWSGGAIRDSFGMALAGIVNTLNVSLRGARLPQGNNSIEVGNGINLRTTESYGRLDGGQYVTGGTGTITPDRLHILHATAGSVGAPPTDVVPFPFTAGGAPQNVQLTGRSFQLQPLACSANTATDVTIQYASGVTAEVFILCLWP